MIDKTAATVLAIRPFSETSHVVTWLTEGGEKLTTLIKGACRPRSLFMGQYDLFYTCELVFYRNDHHDLHVAKECSPIESRIGLRRDWRAAAGASYLCGLLADMTQTGAPQPQLAEHLTATLDFLSAHGSTPQLLLWFEIRLCGILGWAPQLPQCASCGKPIRPSRGPFHISIVKGGACCPPCSAAPDGASLDLPADSLAIMKRWQSTASPRAAGAMRCTSKQLLVCRTILGRFLAYHADLMPEGRRIALDLASCGASATGRKERR
jgi:DNA repair protein RecO (recombination protein O)